MKRRAWIAGFINSFVPFILSAQEAAVFLVDSANGLPVSGAAVRIESSDGKSQYYFANGEGICRIELVSPGTYSVHHVGYEETTGAIYPGDFLKLALVKSAVDLHEVVVTGQYDISTTDKSLYHIRVIDDQKVRQMGAQNLAEALEQELSIGIATDPILGSSASINGISGQNIKILVDGVPLTGRENGNIDLGQVNLNNVERIEIIEGPMSVMYGTNALGGVVNIVTRRSSSYPWQAEVNMHYETVGTFDADGACYFRAGNHSVNLSGGRYFFDGYPDSDTSRFVSWKPKLQYFATGNYNYSASRWNLGFKSDFFNEEIRNPGNIVQTPYQAYAFDDYYFTRRTSQTMLYEYRLKHPAKMQFTNSFSRYRRIKNTYRKDMVTLDEELTSGSGLQDTSRFDDWLFRGTYGKSLNDAVFNYQAGYDINLQHAVSGNLEPSPQDIGDYAVFASLEYRAGLHWHFRPALRAAYNTRYGAPVTPSFNVKYDISDYYILRAAYSRGFRAPSLKELNLSFVDANHHISGNDTLNAETSDHMSAGISLTRPWGRATVKADAALFYNNIRQIITLVLVDPASQHYTYINLDRYETLGFQCKIDFRFRNVLFATGFSLLGVSNSLADSAGVDAFSLIPEFINQLTLNDRSGNWEGSFFFKSTGSRPGYALDENNEVYQTFIESYLLLDASVTRHLMKKRMSVIGGVKNILNVSSLQTTAPGGIHSAGGDVPYAMGRYFFTGVRFNWHQ